MYERSILKSSQRVLALAHGELKNERWPLVADQNSNTTECIVRTEIFKKEACVIMVE